MIRVLPSTNPERAILIFQYPHAKVIKQVCAVGSFNDFSQTATPLRQVVPNGVWEAQVSVPRKGEVSLRYLVNGSKWELDPDTPTTRANAKGDLFTMVNTSPTEFSGSASQGGQASRHTPETLRLVQKAPAVLNKPKERISLAQQMLEAALQPEMPPQVRLDLLQRAANLDPFNTQVRLALGQACREAGLHDEAVACFRQVLEMLPGDPRVLLPLGEALIEAGQLDQAAETLKKVPADDEAGRRAAFGLLELDLRRGTDKDGQKLLQTLSALQARPGEEALFSEKCLKLLAEWDSPEICQAVLELIDTQFGQSNHPALAVVRSVAAYQPAASLEEVKNAPAAPGTQVPAPALRLVRTLNAHRLARALPVAQAQDRVSRLAAWRDASQRLGSSWPELQGAYLHQVGDWAVQAYKKKDFNLAVTLWGEAERVAPNLPAVQQNLAIGNSRLGEDAAQEFYWQRLTRSWTLYNELMPEADGYDRHIIQKHQAFVQGAEAKLATLKASPEQMLELGALWIKEAVPLLALSQLAFRNPLFRCGVISYDYVGKEEKETLLQEGYSSTAGMLQLSLEWLGINLASNLAQKRLLRLDQAYQQARVGGDEAFRHYDEEKDAFKRLREQAAHQYLQLLFGVLLPSAEKLNLDDATSSQRYAQLARGMMVFPHRALKPAVTKVVQQLDEDTDMQQLVTSYAVGPWFKRAQELLKNKQAAKAAPMFEEALKIAPHFSLGMFYLAQCRIEEKRYDEIEPLLVQAREHCKPDDDLLEHIDNLLEQLPMVKIAEEFHQAQEFMQEEDWQHALDNLEYCDSVSPGQVPVLFYTAVCHFRLEEWDAAEKTAKRTLKLCKGEEHKNAKEQLEMLIKQLPMARVSKSIQKARQHMDAEQWREALSVLDKLLVNNPDVLVAVFYKAVCHFRREEWANAQTAVETARGLASKDDKEIVEQLDVLEKQIPLARQASAMREITNALEGQNWLGGRNAANRFLSQNPNHPVAMFYLAVCQLRLGYGDEAKATAQKALKYAGAPEYKDLREQLNQVIQAAGQSEVAESFKSAVEAIKDENWSTAMLRLFEVINKDPNNAAAHYYLALCQFQGTMQPLQESGRRIDYYEVKNYISTMEGVLSSLDKAEKFSSRSDHDLRKGIDNLRKAANNVLRQLKGK